MSNEAAVFETLAAIVVDVLGAEPDEVTPEAYFAADLGGESIDLLDLGFRCEKQFGIPVKFQDLTSQDLVIAPDGPPTPESLDRLRQRFPRLDVSRWMGRAFNRPIDLLTIGDIAAIVASELQRAVETEPSKCA